MSRVEELKALAEKPTETWLADLEYHAECVRKIMQEIHGGRFNYSISHRRTPLVMVAQRIEV